MLRHLIGIAVARGHREHSRHGQCPSAPALNQVLTRASLGAFTYWNSELRNCILNHKNLNNQPKLPPTDEWTNKIWLLHIIQYYLAIKRNEVLIHTTTWVTIGNMILSDKSQASKVTQCVLSFVWNVQNRQMHRHRADQWSQGCGQGEWEWLLMALGLLYGGIKMS